MRMVDLIFILYLLVGFLVATSKKARAEGVIDQVVMMLIWPIFVFYYIAYTWVFGKDK